MTTDIKYTRELVDKLKSFGYNVYLSGSETYGFFYDKEDKLISFHIDYFFFNFSSSHKSKGFGSGHRITKDEQCNLWDIEKWGTKEFFESLLNCQPYRGREGQWIRWTTVEEHLKTYGESSKYTKQ